MNAFKKGDIVLISNTIDKTKEIFGLDMYGHMLKMCGEEVTVVRESNGRVCVKNSDGGMYTFSPSDISPISNIIAALINGQTIENPIQYGIKGGTFAGYLVKFGETHYVSIDAKGIAQLTFTQKAIVPNETQFVVTQEKIKFHTIAFKLVDSDNWHINKVSDSELTTRKSTFSEYKILESWEKNPLTFIVD